MSSRPYSSTAARIAPFDVGFLRDVAVHRRGRASPTSAAVSFSAPLMSAATTLRALADEHLHRRLRHPGPRAGDDRDLAVQHPHVVLLTPRAARRRTPGIGAASMTPNVGGVRGGSGSGHRTCRRRVVSLTRPNTLVDTRYTMQPIGHWVTTLPRRRLEVVVAHRPGGVLHLVLEPAVPERLEARLHLDGGDALAAHPLASRAPRTPPGSRASSRSRRRSCPARRE